MNAKTSVSFNGNPLTLVGRNLSVADSLPQFKLTANDMSDIDQDFLKEKTSVILSVPSLDTPVCSEETKRFNTEAANLSDSVSILVVSMDLPFAQKRWCGLEGVSKVTTASDYKYRSFGENFGCHIQEWGLLARAVFVANKDGKLVYVEYVAEISSEPNYDAALEAIKSTY